MAAIKPLKKGDILLREGELSHSMYWVQAGTLRLYKKKGPGFVELGVVHAGEVVGEMSFLDKQPRSASAEALQPCDVVEIPRGNFEEFLQRQPSWMMALLQTLITRLRSASNRLRELEAASVVYGKNEEGRLAKRHEFLSVPEQLKLISGLLLAAARHGEAGAPARVKASWISYYGGQIFQIPLAKVQVFVDVLQDAGVVKIARGEAGAELQLLDLPLVERYLSFASEENQKTEEQRFGVSPRAMAILRAIAEHGALSAAAADAEHFTVDLASVMEKAKAARQEPGLPFDFEAAKELNTTGFSGELKAEGQQKPLSLNLPRFRKLYPLLALRARFAELNAQKREG